MADTHFKGWICHALFAFMWMTLLCQSKLLHESLWLWIVTTEIAVDHSLILSTTLREDILAERVRNLSIEDSLFLEE